MIGTSAWHRGADSDVADPADKLVGRLKELGIQCKTLTHKEEAYYEAVSVAYAAKTLGVPKVDAVIGGGGNSVQYMHEMKIPIGLTCGWKEAQEAMQKEYAKTKDIDAALRVAHDFVNDEGVGGGRVQNSIKKATSLYGGKNFKDKITKLRGTVICISSCYFAANAAGINNKPDEAKGIAMSECMEKFRSKVARLEAYAREKDNTEKFMAGSVADHDTMTLVNLKLQIKLFETFFDNDTELIFKRNWLLPGNVPFRTTWSAGFFLSELAKKNIHLPGTNTILQNLKDLRKQCQKTVHRRSFNMMQCNAEGLAMVMVSFPNAVDHIRTVARKIGEVVEPILKRIAKEHGGRMEGLEYRIKSEESLNQKLIRKIVAMGKAHRGMGSFCPSLVQVIQAIHDGLRYTMIFPPKTYFEGIKAVENTLMDGEGGERFSFEGIAKVFKAKNSWQVRAKCGTRSIALIGLGYARVD